MKSKNSKKILAIETSCDETAAAVLEIFLEGKTKMNSLPKITTLSSIVKSQIKLHSKMGGVVPEAAARAHVKYIRPVVEKALKTCNLSLNEINYIAVTQGPGLLPSLMVGVEFAKALAYANNIPMIPVNHMAGHLYSPFGGINSKFEIRNSNFPLVSLVVSGGHTMIVLISAIGGSASGGKNTKEYKVLGQTVDDAAGEAFDKVAKMLSLPYPGGPEVSKLALQGNPKAISFPRPMINEKNYNFSFSGLKTAVLYKIQSDKLKVTPLRPAQRDYEGQARDKYKADLCASFQEAVVDVLVTKTMRAVKEYGANSISLSGGVAANRALRDKLHETSKEQGIEFFVPPINLCTDNAEMIGLAAAYKLHNGFKPVKYNKVEANPNLSL